MSFRDDLLAMAVTAIQRYDGGDSITVADVTDVAVEWDSGDRYDPEQECDNALPELSVRVIYTDAFGHSRTTRVDAQDALSSMMRAVLRAGL